MTGADAAPGAHAAAAVPASAAAGAVPVFELRVPTDPDAEAWFELFHDASIMRHIGDGRVQPLEWYRGFVARQQALAADTGLCLFALASAGAVAGFVGIQPWRQEWGPTGRSEIGWRLGSAHQHRGLATAGARRVLAIAAEAGVHDPVAMIDVGNLASAAVATKLGMVAESNHVSPSGALVAQYGFVTSA